MRQLSAFTILLIASGLVASTSPVEPQHPAQDSFRVEISHYYFSHENDALLTVDEYLATGRAHRNDVGWSLMAKAEVEGKKGAFVNQWLKVVAKTEQKTVAEVRHHVGMLGAETGRYAVPMFVYGTLCGQVQITAVLEGTESQVTDVLDLFFSCGE